MLFNSYEFILVFLPITLCLFFILGKLELHTGAKCWLILASLFFYGWWNPVYLILILFSIAFNFTVGLYLTNKRSRILLIFGVATNLTLLGYFKYANFFVDNFNYVADTNFHLETIVLPLAISFFTFQQIAYLVDAFKAEAKEYNFLSYSLFVTFFPQLIAGPIVHHKEMLPQFGNNAVYKFHDTAFSHGISIFVMGLFKKVVLADGVAQYSSPVFSAAESGNVITFFEAWGGAFAYTFQLYFDFSGYSDMAVGIALMFGIHLPINFFSPYKATNIIDFWRRWHMTLSRFLKDYLYIALGGNRRGKTRRYVYLAITMLLGGLWHGAGWTFVVWGALHGLYLIINHAWHATILNLRLSRFFSGRAYSIASGMLTFFAVVVAWVFFRADSFSGAIAILKGMAGMNGATLDARLVTYLPYLDGVIEFQGRHAGSFQLYGIPWILALSLAVWFSPNVLEVMRYSPDNRLVYGVRNNDRNGCAKHALIWQPNLAWAICIGATLCYTLFNMYQISEFLYFQF
jgi:D-alanyl-lipoteichoic acid acyltransferase DltB (MBOAT superfamily)